MKVAVIYSGSEAAAWSVADGLCTTLKKMGHKVAPCPRGRMGQPKLSADALNMADLVIVSGPEHVLRLQNLTFINANELSEEDWLKKVKVPKAFIYHESNTREDGNFKFHLLLPWADHHFFPAIQDASFFDQARFAQGRAHWLPFGVDTDIFCPPKCSRCRGLGKIPGETNNPDTKLLTALPSFIDKFGDPCPDCNASGFGKNMKRFECGFIGMLYGKRKIFLNALRQHFNRVPVMIGQTQVRDIDGIHWQDNVKRLADNYRSIAVFLNFPHLSQLLVTKVYEVMACGTYMLTPLLTGEAEANCDQFRNATHLAYYSPSNVPFLNQLVGDSYDNEETREQIATAGMMEVRKKHRLDQRLTQVLRVMGVKEKVPEVVGVGSQQQEEGPTTSGLEGVVDVR